MDGPILTVRDLVKSYRSVIAVDGISFDIAVGEVFGLLGPNGAGKTTTLECIEGLRTPSSGEIVVDGLHPIRDRRALRRVLGVQLQSSALPEVMLVEEAMRLVSAWHGVERRDDLMEGFGLDELARRQYGILSTGQKRRLQLALALCGDPRIVILDEPTAGVDVQGRAELHAAIRALVNDGVTVILATHDMAEAEALCDRIAILVGGRLATLGTAEQITAAGRGDTRITVRTRDGSLIGQGGATQAVFQRESEGFAQWLCRDTAPAVMELLSVAIAAEDDVEDLRVERPSLEERFLELVSGEDNR